MLRIQNEDYFRRAVVSALGLASHRWSKRSSISIEESSSSSEVIIDLYSRTLVVSTSMCVS